MGVAYYPMLECAIPHVDSATAISGKALAGAMEVLDFIANRKGLTTLSSFYSESTAEAFENIGDDVPEGMPNTPARWFEPAEAIPTLDALSTYIAGHPMEVDRAELVLQDLTGLRNVLEQAQTLRTRFRLRIDI